MSSKSKEEAAVLKRWQKFLEERPKCGCCSKDLEKVLLIEGHQAWFYDKLKEQNMKLREEDE
jgi:hypothetical protein